MTSLKSLLRALGVATLTLACAAAWADEALLRKNWAEHNPGSPPIDELTKTPIPGLYELRMGPEIFYVDETGTYILFVGSGKDGHIIDMRSKTDITEARVNKLNAIDVAALPFKDAIVIKQGSGARRLVVFEDPNCTYCKALERDLQAVKDVTIYTFLMPILGQDSVVKSRDIWCAKDSGKAWRNWMVRGTMVPREMGKCDFSALQRNTDLGQKFRIQGTPAIVFDDGSRVPGVISLDQIEDKLAKQAAAAKKG